MSHATHFLERVERLNAPQADFALSLYRDPGFVGYLLTQVRLPDGAGRVALALGDREAGPFVVVSRDGDFVTCLGAGMRPTDLHVVSRAQVDLVFSRVEAARNRMDEMIARDPHPTRRLLRRLLDSGDALSREEFSDLVLWQPLLFDEYLRASVLGYSALLDDGPYLAYVCRRGARPADYPALRAFWRLTWAIGHTALLLQVDGRCHHDIVPGDREGKGIISWSSYRTGCAPVALRGAWAVGRVGRPLLPCYQRYFRSAPTPDQLRNATLGLAAIAARHSKLRRDVQHALRRAPLTETGPLERWVNAEAAVCAAAFRLIFETRDDFLRFMDTEGRNTYLAHTRDWPADWPGAYRHADDIPPDVLRAFLANLDVPYFTSRDGQELLLNLTVLLAREKPEQLYFPRALLPSFCPPFKPEYALDLLRRQRERHGPLRPREVERVGRNTPCPCGSGRKYKQCCAGGPSPPARAAADPDPPTG